MIPAQANRRQELTVYKATGVTYAQSKEEALGLSDYDKKVLEQLERDLVGADDAFARKLNSGRANPTNSAGKLIAGALIAVIGMSVVVFGAMAQLIVFGVVGFLVALLGLLMASANAVGRGAKNRERKAPAAGAFFENRWDKRRDQ